MANELGFDPTPVLFPGEMTELLVRMIPAKMPILLTGKPGQGKTDVVYQAAALCGADVIVAHPVVDDPTDYKGMPAIVEDVQGNKSAVFLPFGNLKSLLDAKKLTVYFMDDLGQAQKTVQAAAMQLLLARKINGHDVSDHVAFVAATNRKEDKAGVTGILEPVKDRFVVICEMVTSLDDWVKWALKKENNIPHELISFIRYRPQFLTSFMPTSDMTKSPTPRTLAGVGKLLGLNLPKSLELRTFSAAAGKEFAIEFTGFLRVYKDMPDPDAVLMDPHGAIIPSEKSSLYALCGALSARASEGNVERFVTYINRLPDEFSVLTMRDAITRDKTGIPKTKAFIEWASAHIDVMI